VGPFVRTPRCRLNDAGTRGVRFLGSGLIRSQSKLTPVRNSHAPHKERILNIISSLILGPPKPGSWLGPKQSSLKRRMKSSLCRFIFNAAKGLLMKITYDADVDALGITFRETTVTTKHLAEAIAAPRGRPKRS
jgi:hypothetical protein